MVERIPLGRMGKADEVAALICFLASEEMSFSTGATYDISGGRATLLMLSASATAPPRASSRARPSRPRSSTAFELRDPGRTARGMGRRRHVRAQPRRTSRGERGQGAVHARLRRRAAGALPQGRRLPAHGRPRRADRRARRLCVGRPRARDRARARRARRARRPDDRQRRLLAGHRGHEPALPAAGQDLRRAHARSGRPCSSPTTGRRRSRSACASPTPRAASFSRARRRPRRCAARSSSSSGGSCATTRFRPAA